MFLFVSERATQLALDAIQILGGNGYINDYPTGRIMRDAKLFEIGAGKSRARSSCLAAISKSIGSRRNHADPTDGDRPSAQRRIREKGPMNQLFRINLL